MPTLSNNIKCGNSLIGSDYYRDKNLDLFGKEEMNKVNVFDWDKEFTDIFKNGGFDCVVGNPPFLFITEISEVERDYFFKNYTTSEYRFDVYGLFIENSLTKILNTNGFISFIIPHTLLANDSFTKLRKMILNNTHLKNVIDIGPNVFQGAKNETMIFIAEKAKPGATKVILTTAKAFPHSNKQFSIKQTEWLKNSKCSWLVNTSPDEISLISKLTKIELNLGGICTINQGLRTGDNDKYLSKSSKSNIWKHAAGGKEVGRYQPLKDQLFVYYEPSVLDAPRKKEIFESKEKIVVQEIRNITLARRIIATYDNQQFYCLQSTNVINPIKEKIQVNIKFLLGIINSRLINYFFRKQFPSNNHIASNQLAQIPIIIPEKEQENKISGLVDQILNINKQSSSSNSDLDQQHFKTKIDIIDQQIDELVYELYGLSTDEIKIILDANK